MNNYVYHNPGKIIFGRGCEQSIGGEIARYAKRCLIVLGGPFIKENGLYDRVAASLEEAGADQLADTMEELEAAILEGPWS